VARMVKRSLAEATPVGHAPAWADQPGVACGSWVEFTVSTCGETLAIHSLPGIFSFDRVDEGTGLLLAQLAPDRLLNKRVLDFGCGYGLIGMAAARLGAAWVDLIDVDLTAVTAARENLSRNGITNAQVYPSDVLEAVNSEHYDLILTNPPFHAGKQVEYGMAQTLISHARQVLDRNGRLVLVANRFIRYDRLMMDIFGNVERLAETGKYHVLESVH
jgi:16S rRNA (guanine1207-N2)-methyltransferase